MSVQIEAVLVSEGRWAPSQPGSQPFKVLPSYLISLPHLTRLPQITATARRHDADKEQKAA